MSDYTMLHKYGKCMRQLKIKTKLKKLIKYPYFGTFLMKQLFHERLLDIAS